jgi:predicted permease
MFQELFNIIAPVLVIAGIGFAWIKLGQPFDTGQLGKLVVNIGTPMLVIKTFNETRPDAGVFLEMSLASLAIFVGFFAIGFLVLKLARLPVNDYLPGLSFPNTGNMGLPLCLFAFGEHGLALAIVIFLYSAVGNFTIGLALVRGEMNVLKALNQPIIYAVAVGLAISVGEVELPQWISNTVGLLGGLTIPIMLLALGVSLASLKAHNLLTASWLSAVRLGGGFLVGLGVATALGLEGAAFGVVVLQATMPTAVFNYLFAATYGRAGPEVAGMVLVSTLLSFVTLPLLLWFLLERTM